MKKAKYNFNFIWLGNKSWFGNLIRKINILAAAAAKSLQSCLTLCDPRDGSPPGPAISGILQARILKWIAISSSKAWKWKVKVKSLSCVRLLATHGLQPTRLLHLWDFPGNSTGVGCHCILEINVNISLLLWEIEAMFPQNN